MCAVDMPAACCFGVPTWLWTRCSRSSVCVIEPPSAQRSLLQVTRDADRTEAAALAIEDDARLRNGQNGASSNGVHSLNGATLNGTHRNGNGNGNGATSSNAIPDERAAAVRYLRPAEKASPHVLVGFQQLFEHP